MSRALLLPLVVVAVLYAALGPSPAVAGVVVLVALPPHLFGVRFSLSRPAQWLLGLAVVGIASAMLATLFPVPRGSLTELRTGWATWAGASLLLAASRGYIREPMGGAPVTLAILLSALTACGGMRSSLFLPFAVLFAATALYARRSADAGHAPYDKLGRRHLASVAVSAAVAGVVTFAGAAALPRAHLWALGKALSRFKPRSGFSRHLDLGEMRGMLLSDKKVLRVRGPKIDHLRGIVYRHYDYGRWTPGSSGIRTIDTATSMARGADVTELEVLEDEPERYFLPLDTSQIAVSSGIAQVDHFGVLSPIAAQPADRIWFRRGERLFPIDEPSRPNLAMNSRLFHALVPLAKEWTRGLDDPERQLRAIELHLLSDYRYSLEFEQHTNRDPILDFLYLEKRGHCEYFASALALLGRAVGIPTRVVGGYRVTERNELGGYSIVREQNAHTWVEAWLDGKGWVTFNPTPAGPIATSSTTPTVAALIDLAGTGWTAFLSWLDRRTWVQMLSAPAILIMLIAAIRLWRQRRARARQPERTDDRPLPCFDQLSAALAQKGVARAPTETPEQLARRIEEGDDARELASSAALLRRYAALRYGGLGSEPELASDIERFCRQLEG